MSRKAFGQCLLQMMKGANYNIQKWIDWIIGRFEEFTNNVEGHYGHGCLFDPRFQEAYLERVLDCHVDFLDEAPPDSQIKKDSRALCGKLLSACQSGVGRRILMENSVKQGVICSWFQMVQQYDTDVNRHVRIKRLKRVIHTVFHRNYREELVNWSQHYENAFTELALLG
jgi:hypothetical protein